MNMHMVPSDPLYVARQQWYYDLINAPEAWDVETGEASVVVAVLDTGIDATHADLQGVLWTNPFEIDGNGIDDDMNGCIDDLHGCSFAETSSECTYDSAPNNKIEDDLGHGTMVAGIVAARTNKVGVTGVAPGIRVMPVKVLDCAGAGDNGRSAGVP
jgi:subtilisin family serine protease